MSVLKPYTEENDYGGYTWEIELMPSFSMYIKGTGEGYEYHVTMEEFKWFYWEKKMKFISNESLRKTIISAFERGYNVLKKGDEYIWPKHKMESMKEDALKVLDEYEIYNENIKPLEDASDDKDIELNETFRPKNKVSETEYRSRMRSRARKEDLKPMTASRFEDRFSVLSEHAVEKLRDGKKLYIEDVRWQALHQRSILFNVTTIYEVRDLRRAAFKKEDEYVVPFSKKITENNLVQAEYALKKPLSKGGKRVPDYKVPYQDGRGNIHLAMEDLGGGREELRVTDCQFWHTSD